MQFYTLRFNNIKGVNIAYNEKVFIVYSVFANDVNADDCICCQSY